MEFNQFSKKIMSVSMIVPSRELFISTKHGKKNIISIIQEFPRKIQEKMKRSNAAPVPISQLARNYRNRACLF